MAERSIPTSGWMEMRATWQEANGRAPYEQCYCLFPGERETNVYSLQIGCQRQTKVTIQTNLIDMSVPWQKQMKMLESFHSVRVYWITVDLQKHGVIARHS